MMQKDTDNPLPVGERGAMGACGMEPGVFKKKSASIVSLLF